jgi:hypothetical protein
MNILKWVHKWTRFLQFHPFRWNVMAAHFFYSRNLRESGTLLIFKVKGQGHRVKFLGEGIHHALPLFSLDLVSMSMILTQTWPIGLLLNSHTVKHTNCYGSSHYFLKILFIKHTYKIQTKQGQRVAYYLICEPIWVCSFC